MRIGKYEDWSYKIYTGVDMYFISIENMKWKFGNMYQISFENIKHFLKPRNQNKKTRNLSYFQVRESLVPLNIPTPTPSTTTLLILTEDR